MARHASNSDRIARAAAEAEAKSEEKAAKAKTRAAAAPRKARPARSAGRMKVVWAVGVPGLVPVKTFPSAERAAAYAEAAKRGKGCTVSPLKIPME